MQLDEFVKASIVQIVKGVKEAQKEVKQLGGVVNPLVGSLYGLAQRESEKIEFDVALVVQDAKGSEVGGGISVASVFGIGASVSGRQTGSDSYQQTSRVKFNVYVDLPCSELSKRDDHEETK